MSKNQIDLPLERNDHEFWQFYEQEGQSLTIVTHVPQALRDVEGYAQALNAAARRLVQFHGGLNYDAPTDYRVGADVNFRQAPAAPERRSL